MATEEQTKEKPLLTFGQAVLVAAGIMLFIYFAGPYIF